MDCSVRIASTFRRPPRESTLATARLRAEAGGVKWDALRKRLVRARTTAPLFRTADFTRDFEGVLQRLLRSALEEKSDQLKLPQSSGETTPAAKKQKNKKKKKGKNKGKNKN